jgi:hypothetical protein
MITGSAKRGLLVVLLVSAWGCLSEPSGPATDQPPAAGAPAVPPAATSPTAKPDTDRPPGQPLARSQTSEEEEAIAKLAGMLHNKKRLSTLRAKAISTGDPELDPLVAFLSARFADEIKAGKTLVILDQTKVFTMDSYEAYVDSLLKEASDLVPAEMIRDFGDKNRQSRMVWPELSQHLPARLLAGKDLMAISKGGPDDFWKRFYDKYPGAPGLLTVSRVGLSREKDRALFYVGLGSGSLAGHGQLHVLKKEGDLWVEQPVEIGPSWTS